MQTLKIFNFDLLAIFFLIFSQMVQKFQKVSFRNRQRNTDTIIWGHSGGGSIYTDCVQNGKFENVKV